MVSLFLLISWILSFVGYTVYILQLCQMIVGPSSASHKIVFEEKLKNEMKLLN